MPAGDQENLAAARDRSVTEDLARETGIEHSHVKELYELELAQLAVNAKVRGFLSVLACRNVRMALRQKSAHTY
jgi:ketopantoate reductase